MGEDHTRRPSRRRNCSGEADATARPADGTRTTAAYGAGLPVASAAPKAAMSPLEPGPGSWGAESRRVRLTWYTSPRPMAARMSRTPSSKSP